MINDVTVLSEWTKLRRVLFDRAKSRNTELFLWLILRLCSISNKVFDLIASVLLEGLFIGLDDSFQTLFDVF